MKFILPILEQDDGNTCLVILFPGLFFWICGFFLDLLYYPMQSKSEKVKESKRSKKGGKVLSWKCQEEEEVKEKKRKKKGI